jgi:hypothetical protein
VSLSLNHFHNHNYSISVIDNPTHQIKAPGKARPRVFFSIGRGRQILAIELLCFIKPVEQKDAACLFSPGITGKSRVDLTII